MYDETTFVTVNRKTKNMKKRIAFAVMSLPLILLAQNKKEGVITYEEIVNIHASLAPDQQAYKAMLPETTTSTIRISFRDMLSRVESATDASETGKGNITFSMSGASTHFIVDRTKKITQNLYVFNNKNYYTETALRDTLIKPEAGQSKAILGYACKMAIFKQKDGHTADSYEVWYTEQLGIQCCPIDGFPVKGAVLEIKAKKISFLARKIEIKPTDTSIYVIPAGSKKITREQAEDLQAEEADKQQQGSPIKKSSGK
jgi:GLPGLI family protein